VIAKWSVLHDWRQYEHSKHSYHEEVNAAKTGRLRTTDRCFVSNHWGPQHLSRWPSPGAYNNSTWGCTFAHDQRNAFGVNAKDSNATPMTKHAKNNRLKATTFLDLFLLFSTTSINSIDFQVDISLSGSSASSPLFTSSRHAERNRTSSTTIREKMPLKMNHLNNVILKASLR
jgi:hypothetical protein